MTEIEQRAFTAFVKSNEDHSKEDVEQLEEALNEQIFYTPSHQLQNYMKQYHEPLQVVRDRKIVDYLHMKLGMPLNKATDLWSDWEDHEHEIYEKEVY